ncbi:MAG TPA: AMP-binding protein [Steroidobacteraceae bacterium]|nr:AMP-binding protein [Steroidobacteraceae bacterium]
MLLQAIARAEAGVVALDDGVRAITYGDLGELLRLERDWLRAGRGERYALAADNGVAWALADLALHTGAWPSVPVPGAFTETLKRHALDDAGIDTLLTDDDTAMRALLPDWTSDGVAPASGLHRFRRSPDACDKANLPAGTRKITYTSGSTARPKGVCLDGAALEAVAGSVAEATSELPIARHLCLLPLWTLLENVAGLYAPLLRGATCVLPSCATTGMGHADLDARRLLGTISAQSPHSLILVPELLQVLVEAAERGWRVPRSLRFVAVGGARVTTSLLERAEAVRLPVYEGYGLSECASVVCLNTPRARRAGTVGRPLPHVRVRVDGDGQVRVAGHVMLGYLGDRPPPGGELATGDLGTFDDDGYLRLTGRAGHRFITSYGRNVSPEWIESEISQRLGAAPVCAFGEARPYVVALVGASHAAANDAAIERAIADANSVLPDYARVRRWARADRPFSFDDGTLSANGRLRRAEIRARHDALVQALYTEAIAS